MIVVWSPQYGRTEGYPRNPDSQRPWSRLVRLHASKNPCHHRSVTANHRSYQRYMTRIPRSTLACSPKQENSPTEKASEANQAGRMETSICRKKFSHKFETTRNMTPQLSKYSGYVSNEEIDHRGECDHAQWRPETKAWCAGAKVTRRWGTILRQLTRVGKRGNERPQLGHCLLYTSDAADE